MRRGREGQWRQKEGGREGEVKVGKGGIGERKWREKSRGEF